MRPLFTTFAVLAVLLGGCASTVPAAYEKPVSEMTPCEAAVAVINSPWADYEQKETAREIARNRGCFGRAKQQRVEVNVKN